MLLNDQAHSRMQLSGMSQCSTLFGDEFTDWLNTIALIPHKATKGRCEDRRSGVPRLGESSGASKQDCWAPTASEQSVFHRREGYG
jgi:hypothetical protein